MTNHQLPDRQPGTGPRPEPSPPAAAGPGTSTALEKAVDVLTAFSVDRTTLSFSDIRALTGMPKSTTHRLLTEMTRLRLLDRVGDRYRLSRLVFEVGMRASVERGLLEVATPYLEELRERTQETVHLGVREGGDVVYVAKLGGHRQAQAPSRLGGRMPLHATAIGKVLLAHSPTEQRLALLHEPLARYTPRTITAPGQLDRQLDRIVETGLAYEHEESAAGVVCVAAPVTNDVDEVVAAISVAGPATRFQPERFADAVRGCAQGISITVARRAALTR